MTRVAPTRDRESPFRLRGHSYYEPIGVCQCASKLRSVRHREKLGSCLFINECDPYYVGKDKNNSVSAIETKAKLLYDLLLRIPKLPGRVCSSLAHTT